MIDQRFVVLGALIGLIAAGSYMRDTVLGRTQPNRVTWLLWGAAPLLAFAAQLQAHVGLSALMTLSVGVGPLLILAASFVNPRAVWRIGKFDYICGALSVAGTIAWILTRDGNIAIGAAIAADALAGLPTLRKSWRSPTSESRAVFLAGIINASTALLVIRRFDAAHAAFPLYILIADSAVLSILTLRPRRRKDLASPQGRGPRPCSRATPESAQAPDAA